MGAASVAALCGTASEHMAETGSIDANMATARPDVQLHFMSILPLVQLPGSTHLFVFCSSQLLEARKSKKWSARHR
jgi:hypothetical protein